MFRVELDREMAWITFQGDGWQIVWHPVTDVAGEQLEWGLNGKEIMDHCRAQFNNPDRWFSFGIAPTSQMIMGNAVKDNL
jgi:hypothetical protein